MSWELKTPPDAYLARWPEGPHADEARELLAAAAADVPEDLHEAAGELARRAYRVAIMASNELEEAVTIDSTRGDEKKNPAFQVFRDASAEYRRWLPLLLAREQAKREEADESDVVNMAAYLKSRSR